MPTSLTTWWPGHVAPAGTPTCDGRTRRGPGIHGRAALKGLFRQWLSGAPDAHCTVENIIVEGDRAAWLVRTTGTHTGDGLGFPATGKSFETVAVNMGRFRDGVAVEHWSDQGLLSMLLQIGMVPLPWA